MLITLREKRRSTPSQQSSGKRSPLPDTVEGDIERELEIPSTTVASFIAKLGGFTAVVTGFTTLLTFWFTDVPARRAQARNATLDILQRALQVEDSAQRRASLQLLLQLKLIDDKDGALSGYVDTVRAIPHWILMSSPTPPGNEFTSSASRRVRDAVAVDSMAKKPDGQLPPPPPRR